MKRILIVYATREGQTRRIAGHIASTLGGLGHAVDCVDVAELSWQLDWSRYSACILAASVHAGKHEPSMSRFVRGHVRELNVLPTAFVSTSVAEAVVEREAASEGLRRAAAERVEKALQDFFTETGWHPTRTQPVAGALLYGQYGWAMRLIVKAIARDQGLDADTGHDHQYTDWTRLERFVADFSASLAAQEA